MAAVRPRQRPVRLTQQQRSAATRQALIDATIDTLVEDGYERATTTEIAERAGLSRGAHLHHFQTRAALIAAAVEALAERATTNLQTVLAQLPPGPDRVPALIDAVWELFNGPLFLVVVDLSVRARTDDELRQQLAPIEDAMRDGSALRHALSPGSEGPELDALLTLIVASVRGLVVMRVVEPARRADAQWAACRKLLLDVAEQHRTA